MDAAELDDDPLVQLRQWFDAARAAGDPMPDAMSLATATRDGEPSARLVLLRGLDHGLVFFTDYESKKGADLRENPRAAAVLHFTGPEHRQVRVTGVVAPTTPAESDRYWENRPVESRRSAVASHQSAVIESRLELEHRVAELESDPSPPRPARWGGYRLVPETVEFWQEGAHRLHDRLRYVRTDGGWGVERLSP